MMFRRQEIIKYVCEIWAIINVKGKVDAEEKENDCRTSGFEQTRGYGIHYTDGITSNRIKDNFLLTGRVKGMQIKIADADDLGGW